MLVHLNGKLLPEHQATVSVNNRSFRYGDGCFETMKLAEGRIVLSDLHFERLFQSMVLLGFDIPSFFTPLYLSEQVAALAQHNHHQNFARGRIMVFKGDGGLYDTDNTPNWLIQTGDLEQENLLFKPAGLKIGIYKGAIKAADDFSLIKSNNYLPYLMAARWARLCGLDDAIVCNPNQMVADASIANVFVVKDGIIKTPPLSHGPVNGTIRRYLLHSFAQHQITICECGLTENDLLEADEIFFTNAIYGIRWVQQLAHQQYTNRVSADLYHRFISPLHLVKQQKA